MPTLCTYIVTNDKGLAPNPFWNWCTLAVCTPNHQGANLCQGDWIAGFLSRSRQNRFLYAMEIKIVLSLDEYFHDERFQQKKPDLRGDWKARCGDNFYSLDANGKWIQHRNRFHVGEYYLRKDTRKPKVFAGKRFWYFGRLAKSIDKDFAALVPIGKGIRVNHDPELVSKFCSSVQLSFKPGIHAMPNDNDDMPGCNSPSDKGGC